MSLFSGTSQLKDIAGGSSYPLYSGMISGVGSRNRNGTSSSGTLDYDYSYDYLWRLTEATLPGSDSWAEKGITYDRNGNLRSLTRHGGSGSILGRWTTVDPLAEKYPGISPYSYCAGNPVNFVDPDGNSLSTHTDKYGVVQRVIDDGDLGVYRHDGDAEQTISELDSSYSSDYTSGGGELMGKSLHALSFVDMNKYHSTGVVKSLPIKIDFESNELTDMVTRELEKDYSVMNYQRLAAPGGALDSKSKINNGSKLFDTYASPRDAGNFLAGMYAASKGTFGPVIMYGYGAYNLCGNNKVKTALFCLFSLISTQPPAAALINYTYHYGENELSHLGQMLGFNYYKNNYAK